MIFYICCFVIYIDLFICPLLNFPDFQSEPVRAELFVCGTFAGSVTFPSEGTLVGPRRYVGSGSCSCCHVGKLGDPVNSFWNIARKTFSERFSGLVAVMVSHAILSLSPS